MEWATLASGAGSIGGLFTVLAVAGLTALVMGRAGIAAIPAFLIAGAVAGPHALGLVGSAEDLGAISELAIILLLFGIGMHIEPGELRHGSTRLIIVGLASIAACVLLLWPAAMAFGVEWAGALALALALSVSSTAVVLRRLMRRRELHQPPGRLALAVLIVQDLAVPVLLIAIDTLGRIHAGDQAEASTLAIVGRGALSVIGAAALVVGGRLVLPRLLRQASLVGSDEVMLTLGVAAAIGAALATSALGFSHELGAFLAGLVLGGTPFKHQIGALMGPARDFFLAVFFTTLGMAVDPAPLAELWPAVLIGGALMLVIKSIAIGVSSWALWGTGLVAATAGLTLAQAGEFSLILLDSSSDAGLIDEHTKAAAVAIVVISLVLTPVPIMLVRVLRPWLERVGPPPWRRAGAGEASEPEEDGAIRVIIGGFGPIGRVAADHLQKAGVRTTVIELNEKTVRSHAQKGCRFIFGDVSHAEVLDSAGVRGADALILTVPDDEANLRACRIARSMNGEMCIVVRMNHLGKALEAKNLGADATVVEEVAAAQAMERVVIERFGVKLNVGRPDGGSGSHGPPPRRVP
ncbi:MAG: cation:proton antiporter [Phycisphaeraceae bacterium]|nr:MAG: cation:proton antiporter [Phycisphaeraceae bacterium]